MGILISRFRKKKTTIEVLEDLDVKIKEIEEYGQHTEHRHKKIVGTLIIYSVALYIIAAFIFYFYFFPASLYDQLIYITPLLIFPIIILLTKKMVSWYYKRKISRNYDKLTTMQKEKKKILDEVTETETYKKAKEILLKFAPDQLRMTSLSPQQAPKIVTAMETPRRPSAPQAAVPSLPTADGLRRRALTVSSVLPQSPIGMTSNVGLAPSGVSPFPTPLSSPYQAGVRSLNSSAMEPRTPLPRPIFPQQRTYLDRLVEYLVGDGPSNRYALICRQCGSHNGMALKEEFEYFGYRCSYCNFWNPARKQKPSAPKLESDSSNVFSPSTLSSSQQPILSTPSTIHLSERQSEQDISSGPSDTESDAEVAEKSVERIEHTKEPTNDEVRSSLNPFESGSEEEAIEEVPERADAHNKKEFAIERMEVDESPKVN
ncbi:endoplasmic reticulum junction formation protein lunapark-A isoform X1 [Orussus abietinus]|uniref:endoplasmic reticulum junction formation protein lunapark-A isoform X1 n=1 Tax=Orussus abietinus TaxID=222816 RepID=UPI000626BA76|nr:endoplasmic reticulum junction formation protein lunapark-A isoform X1 [Orussus abietinus]